MPADVAYWHGADIKPRPLFGRCGVESGHHWLIMSISAFDPTGTFPAKFAVMHNAVIRSVVC
jgi:hypothetical protein